MLIAKVVFQIVAALERGLARTPFPFADVSARLCFAVDSLLMFEVFSYVQAEFLERRKDCFAFEPSADRSLHDRMRT